jgi:hypothetical protein
MRTMTDDELRREIERIKRLNTPYLSAEQVAPVLGVNSQYFRIRARERPKDYPFQIIQSGVHIKVPKKPFLAWAETLT